MVLTGNGFQCFGFDLLELQHRLQHCLQFGVVQFGSGLKLIQQQQSVCGVLGEIPCKIIQVTLKLLVLRKRFGDIVIKVSM